MPIVGLMRPLRLFVLPLALATVAGCDLIKTPTEAEVVPGAVRYTAVGASDAIGYGASVECFPFSPCPNGTGYVQTVQRRLDLAHEDFESTNLGIPGAVVSRRIQQLGASIGRDIFATFTEGQMPFVPRDSTIVTLFAGGNDVNTVGAAVRNGHAGGNIDGYIASQISAFAGEFQALVNGIRSRATNTRVIVLNLPNMARLPYSAGLSSNEREWMRRLSVGYSAAMNAVRSSDVLVIDLMCHAPIYNSGIYSPDGFHPNDSGYAELANLVTAALTSPPPAPATTCGFMN
jgi:lysophospholipase L1-like esterase